MPLTVREVADLVGGELQGEGSRVLRGASTLEAAGPDDLAFATDPGYLARVPDSRAGAVLVPPAAPPAPAGGPSLIVVERPQVAFARALQRLAARPSPAAGADPRAHVDPSARVAADVHVGAFVWVGPGVSVGPRAVLHPGVYLGEGAEIGADTVLHPRVVVYPGCRLGERVIVHAGAVIGSDGYGFVWDGARHLKVEQVGVAVIEDDVEIGAGCTIDRGALVETRVGRGTKLDNLVHLAHNVVVGENCLFAAQVGIAGSTRIGNGVVLGGQVGVGGHLELGDGVRVGGQGGVAKSLPRAGDYWGTPARSHQGWLKMLASLGRLPDLWRTVRDLAARLDALERRERG